MQFKSFMEALKGKQHKIDKNKNGEIDASDFKLLQKEDREDRADYEVSKSGRKSHKQIVFPDGQPTVDNDKKDSVKEEVSLDEALDPSEIAGNPKMYDASTVKKAYYHKSVSASDKESLARHLDRHHGNKEWRKPIKEAKMSDADMAERERIVKGMKKNLASFKSKYGASAKDVMYATATKMAMKEEMELDEKISTAQMGHAGKTTIKHIKNPTVQQRMAAHDIKQGIAGYRDRIAALKDAQAHGNLKEEDLDEAFINAREYASQGVMHPTHAAHDVHKVTGQSIDFYAHGTGDKVSGKVTKNDGKAVHIKDTKGKTHQFKVTPNLPKQQNEELDKTKKDDKSPPFDGPYSKPGKPGGSMNRARTLARQGMKQAMKEEFDLDITDEQADEIFEAVQKADIPAYLRKQKGDAPLKLSDLKRKDTLSDAENLKRNRGVKEQLELDEAVQSGNKGHGYHGQHDSDVADKKYSAMHSKVKSVAGEAGHMRDVKKPNVMVKHYLDSVHGRHLAGNESNQEYIKKDFGKFKKSYKPEMHEGVDFDQEGNLIAEKLSFGDFIAKMNEQLLEYEAKDGVYKHKGSYGGNYVDPEGADDADDKKKPAPAEKRGRGRPAGAKSGARKITGTSKLFK